MSFGHGPNAEATNLGPVIGLTGGRINSVSGGGVKS
jgi:hypothetical protein